MQPQQTLSGRVKCVTLQITHFGPWLELTQPLARSTLYPVPYESGGHVQLTENNVASVRELLTSALGAMD